MTQIMKLGELQQIQGLKLLLFGDAGVGKTRMAASAHLIEAMRPVVIGAAEGGLTSLLKDPRFADLDVFELTDTRMDPESVVKKVEELYERCQDGYRTVILDTLTEAQRYGLMYLSEQPAGWAGYTSPKKISLPDYGANLLQTGTLVRAFRDLPINVIMTAHVRRATLNVDGHDYVVPSVTGQQWKDVMATFSEVFFMYTKAAVSLAEPEKGVRYKIITKPFENIKAKDRDFDLPVSMDVTDKYLADVLWPSGS